MVMFSLIPAIPGCRRQILRTINFTGTPACGASYSLPSNTRSSILFSLIVIPDGNPCCALHISLSIISIKRCCMVDCATSKCLKGSWSLAETSLFLLPRKMNIVPFHGLFHGALSAKYDPRMKHSGAGSDYRLPAATVIFHLRSPLRFFRKYRFLHGPSSQGML